MMKKHVKFQEEDKDVGQEEVSDITYEGYAKKISFNMANTLFPS